MDLGYWGAAKPPGGTQLDRGHPLSQGLRLLVAFNEGGGVPSDVVRGRLLTQNGTPSWAGSGLGVASRAGAIGDYWLLGANPDLALPTSRTTVLLIRRKTDATARSSAAFGSNAASGSTARIGAHVPFSDGIVYWDFGGAAGANRLTASGLSFGGTERWAFVAGSRGSAIYQNGIRRASQASAITRVNAGNDSFYLNASNGLVIGSSGDLQDFVFFAVLDAEWTADQVQAWTAQPYAMFAPPVWRRYFAPVAALLAARQRALLGVGV